MPTVAKIAGKYVLKMSGEHNTEKRDKVAQVAGFMAQRYGFRKEVSVSLNLLGHFLASLKKPKHRCRKKSSGLGNLLQGSELFNVKDNLVSWNLLDSSSEGSEEGPIVVDPTPTQLYDAIKALPEPPAQAAGQPGASKKRRQKPAESFDSPLSAKRQRTVDPPCSTLGGSTLGAANKTAASKTAPRIGANARAVAGGAAAATAAAVVPAVHLLAPPHGPSGCGLAGSGPLGSTGVKLEPGVNQTGPGMGPLPEQPLERALNSVQHPGQPSMEVHDGRQVPAAKQRAQRPLDLLQERPSRLDGADMAAAVVKIEPAINQTGPAHLPNPRAVAGGAAAATAAAVVPAVHLLAPPHGPRGCGLAGSGLSGSLGPLPEQPLERAHNSGQRWNRMDGADMTAAVVKIEPAVNQTGPAHLPNPRAVAGGAAAATAAAVVPAVGLLAPPRPLEPIQERLSRLGGAGMAAAGVKMEPDAGLDRAPLKEIGNTELTNKLKETEARLAAEKEANASLQCKCAGLEVEVVRLAKQLQENANKEQVAKLRNERETTTCDTATLRADLDNTRQERDRPTARDC